MLLPSLQALLGKECRQNVTFDGSRRENIPVRRARHRRGVADKSFARHNERFLRPATTTCIDESTIFAASTICLLLQPRVIARGERVNQTRTHRERCNCALRGGWKTPGDFPLTCSSSAVPGFPSQSSRHGESPRRFSGREIYSMARGGRGGGAAIPKLSFGKISLPLYARSLSNRSLAGNGHQKRNGEHARGVATNPPSILIPNVGELATR